MAGQSALLLVEEESRPEPEPVPTLHQLTLELTVRDKTVRLKTAILTTVLVEYRFIQCQNRRDKTILII